MKQAYIDANKVRQAAAGNWLAVLSTLAPHIEGALKRPGRHTGCPVHGGRDGFRLFKDVDQTGGGICNSCGAKSNGISLLMWLNDWSYPEALKHIAGLLGVESSAASSKRPAASTVQPEQSATELEDQSNVISLYRDKPWLREVQEKIRQRAEREQLYAVQLKERIAEIWDGCLSILDPASKPARIYLNSRGVGMRAISQDALRFHPSLPYHDQEGNKLGEYPCLVAAIRRDGQLVTLHRTYLSSEGTKAKVPGGGPTKKMMPIPHGMDVRGCSIPLLELGDSGVIGVAEGMETALSAARATGIPTWAAVSAVLMECFEVPQGVHTVVIWADKDRSRTGEVSAQALEQRLKKQGIKAHIMLPGTAIPALSKSLDWNDVLVTEGAMGFPSPSYIRTIKSQAQ